MALHPMADQVKIRLDPRDPHGFSGGESTSSESGILIEMTDKLNWLGYHSFSFEKSLGDTGLLTQVYDYYSSFVGKRIAWESMQDSGRRFKEGDDEFILLKITDIIAYDDDVDSRVKAVVDVRRPGSFKV